MSWVELSLGGRADPVSEVVEYGLPGPERLRKIILEDAVPASVSTIDLTTSEPSAGRSLAGSALDRSA